MPQSTQTTKQNWLHLQGSTQSTQNFKITNRMEGQAKNIKFCNKQANCVLTPYQSFELLRMMLLISNVPGQEERSCCEGFYA